MTPRRERFDVSPFVRAARGTEIHAEVIIKSHMAPIQRLLGILSLLLLYTCLRALRSQLRIPSDRSDPQGCVAFAESKLSVSKQKESQAAHCCVHSEKVFVSENISTCAAGTERWTLQVDEDWALYLQGASKRDDCQCRLLWNSLLEARLGCQYIRDVSRKMVAGEPTGFDYVADVAGVPRVLVLGDSITAHARASLQLLMTSNNISSFTLHNAPENCGGIDLYDRFLSIWLGTCVWDLIQFNLGHHCDARVEQLSKYKSDLIRVTRQLQEHSPGAHIVFATTTPSPFDTVDTFPNISTCAHYHKFHYPGRVPALNSVAREVLEPMNVTINDRFALLEPHLKDYQYQCDIHFTERGSDVIAEKDLELFVRLLKLQGPKKR